MIFCFSNDPTIIAETTKFSLNTNEYNKTEILVFHHIKLIRYSELVMRSIGNQINVSYRWSIISHICKVNISQEER